MSPAPYRKFQGHWYKLRHSNNTKKEAHKAAASFRKKGNFLARAVKTADRKDGYAVYYRGAKTTIKYADYLPAPGYTPPEAEEVRRKSREKRRRRR